VLPKPPPGVPQAKRLNAGLNYLEPQAVLSNEAFLKPRLIFEPQNNALAKSAMLWIKSAAALCWRKPALLVKLWTQMQLLMFATVFSKGFIGMRLKPFLKPSRLGNLWLKRKPKRWSGLPRLKTSANS
jgi:hypothetical protein